LYTLSSLDRIQSGHQVITNQIALTNVQVRSAAENLENLGMSKKQIREMARTRRVTQDIELVAPVTSFVLARNLTPGQKIARGDELYKLGDLSRVWILADVYENEARYMRPGLKVRAALPNQNRTFWATVSESLPIFDPVSRTMRVRLEADNPDYDLRPDMFVDLEIPLNLAPVLTVPVDAILDSGLKKTVFVDRGNGYFEPRKVETGWRFDDRAEIVKGLTPGEKIVVSGNFLIDSESRMRLAAAGMYGEVVKDPVCGLKVDQSKAKAAGFLSTHNHETYYFCSEGCKDHFEKNPPRYAEKPAGDQEGKGDAAAKAKDPVCGLEVDVAEAKAGGLISEYQGKTYYFSKYSSNKEFDQDPGRYAAKAAGGGKAAKVIAKDPVCGLDVDQGFADMMGLKREFEGQTYYFRQVASLEAFDQDPKGCLSKAAAASDQGEMEKDKGKILTDNTTTGYLAHALGIDAAAVKPGPMKEMPVTDKDPVCGMALGESVISTLPYKTLHKGKVYYFCSEACKEKFDKTPDYYASKLASAPGPAGAPAAHAPGRPPGTPGAAGLPPGVLLPPPASSPTPLTGIIKEEVYRGPAQPGQISPPAPAAGLPAVPVPVPPPPPLTGVILDEDHHGHAHQEHMDPPVAPAAPPAVPATAPAALPAPATPVPAPTPASRLEGEKGHEEHAHMKPVTPPGPKPEANPNQDPVCGMDLKGAGLHAVFPKSVYKGTNYYFCSEGCKQEFVKKPEHYLKQAEKNREVPARYKYKMQQNIRYGPARAIPRGAIETMEQKEPGAVTPKPAPKTPQAPQVQAQGTELPHMQADLPPAAPPAPAGVPKDRRGRPLPNAALPPAPAGGQ
ncbi:MAG: efflux RND transporter periplasmic adaptor subunit, partial [Desulfobaccales bacterium]